MKIRHPLVIDTAILFPHAKGRPSKPSLKFLTGKWLGREIQNKGGEGHDSEEDARACLDLLRRKCIEGEPRETPRLDCQWYPLADLKSHTLSELAGPDFGETMEDMETIFEKFARHARDSKQPGRSSLLCDYGNATTRMRATRAFVCKDDDEVVENLVENVEDFDFTFARMFGLSNAQKCESDEGVGAVRVGGDLG
jgi:RNA exonuclease 1